MSTTTASSQVSDFGTTPYGADPVLPISERLLSRLSLDFRRYYGIIWFIGNIAERAMSRPLTAREAADALGYHIKHLYRLLKEGTIVGERFNQVWMIDPAEVERVKALQGPGGRLPKEPKQNDT
jgi:hypothetical protein